MNDDIAEQYRLLMRGMILPTEPIVFRPVVTSDDYSNGFITRSCIIKRTDFIHGHEIDPALANSVDQGMYLVYTFSWRIIGKKNRHVVNGIIEDFGVSETNTKTLNSIDPQLVRFFPNTTEFWRGY